MSQHSILKQLQFFAHDTAEVQIPRLIPSVKCVRWKTETHLSHDNISGPNEVSHGMSLEIDFLGLWKINVNILASVCQHLGICIMYNFCPFMSERNTTACHTDFPILHAKCCIGVLMGFQIKSCLVQYSPSWKEELVAHPNPYPAEKSQVKHFFFPPLFFSSTVSLFWKPVQPCSNKSNGTEWCTPSQWVVEPAGQLSIQLLFSLPDLFMPVPDPTAHNGNKEALVASGLPELGASSFNPVLYFIAQETFASGVR